MNQSSSTVWLPCLQTLHHKWWGNTSTDLTIANDTVDLSELHPLDNLTRTENCLIVRKEYVYLFERLLNFSRTPGAITHGVVVTGQPGIGKSIFLLYVLLHLLQDRRDFILHLDAETYAVCKDGPFTAEPSHFYSPKILVPAGTWALIDSQPSQKEPPPFWLTRHCSILPIFTTSPDKQRYDNWMKSRSAVTFVMDPWSDEEMALSAHLLDPDPDLRNRYLDLLPEAIVICGPVIWDIHTVLLSNSPDIITKRIDNALTTSGSKQLANLFMNSDTYSEESHSLILMKQQLTSVPLSGDNVLLDFRSLYVAWKAWNRFWRLENDEAMKYFSLFGKHGALSIAGGWLFENIAHRHMCKIIPTDSSLLPMIQMTYAARPVYTNPPGSAGLYFLPVHDEVRRPVFYDKVSEIKLDFSTYYIPRRSNNPLFDAIFFGPRIPDLDASTGGTSLYILQMSTATVHGGSGKGVDTICEILRTVPSVIPTYVLVVPDSEPHSWKMLSGWYSKCQGQVYCQQIRTDIDLTRQIGSPLIED
ncbi:hypothetical protein ARMGADRAFT_1069607 [Armillaria gallica]|nr:hypothetical protein ARMGADRAFT_1069607 [Armillaria gallica]